MNIGLCGGHRTGKTTLAEAIALKTGMPFVRTGTSEIFKRHGLEPAKPMDFQQRIWIQHKILDAAEEQWHSEQGQFITDRTPLDMAAYTLADIRGETEVNFVELELYLSRCFETTNRLFSVLVLLQPGIPLMHEAGKAALNEGYIEHLNYLILGLCSDSRISSKSILLNRDVTTLDDRIRVIMDKIEAWR